jgi:hypothetical protein
VLQAAYFSYFKGHSDILLFWGNDADLRELRDALGELSTTGQARHFAGRNCGIDLRRAAASAGARRQGERLFDWAIDSRDAADFRDKVAALIASSGAGHQYLTSVRGGGITVMVSRAEYPPDLKAEPLPELDRPYGLAVAGWLLVAIALLVQALAIGFAWSDFDPRLTCDRLQDWSEWIDCLHGTSHPHIGHMELAAAGWIGAGLTALLGRFLPPFASAIVPLLLAAFVVFRVVEAWDNAIIPQLAYDDLTLEASVFWQQTNFAIIWARDFISLVLPAAGAWLLATHARRMRKVYAPKSVLPSLRGAQRLRNPARAKRAN